MAGFWIRINPQGCVVGSVLEECVGRIAEDAHKEFTPRVADRRKEAAQGWRHELVGCDEWDRRAKPCLLNRCGHRSYGGRPVADVQIPEAAS